jgi:hypothetical protein
VISSDFVSDPKVALYHHLHFLPWFITGSSKPQNIFRSSLLAQISRLYPLYLDPSKISEKVLL